MRRSIVLTVLFLGVLLAPLAPLAQTPQGTTIRTDSLQLAFLLGAACVWAFSMFCVGEAGKMAAWASGEEPGAPNPESGVLLSRICSGAILGLWVLYTLGLDVNSGDFVGMPTDGPELRRHITLIVIARPGYLIHGFLVASILPCLVAVLKWSQAIAARRGRAKWTPIVQMTVYLLSLAASAVVIFRHLWW